MALFMLIALSSYVRPSELLRARVCSLVRPADGVTKSWSLLLAPEEESIRTKTGDFDVSTLLDSPWMQGWGDKLFDCLKHCGPQHVHQSVPAFRSHCHSVSNKTLRSLHRLRSPVANAAGCSKARPVEDPEKRHKVREERSPRQHMGEVASKLSHPCPDVRARPWGNPTQAKGSSPVFRNRCKGKYVMDLFAGSEGLSKAVARFGFRAKQWDMRHGSAHDLTSPQVVRRILREIRRRRVLAVMLAPVCTSFSVARDRAKVIRTRSHPWGIADHLLTEKEKASVQLGNACFKTCLRILKELDKYRIPYLLEDPATSKAWWLPDLALRLTQAHATVITADFCQFGAKWRKRTTFLAGHIQHDDLHRLQRVCTGKGGFCGRTGCKHWQLTGSSGGVPWTKIAEPYPQKLCTSLAYALTAPHHSAPYTL